MFALVVELFFDAFENCFNQLTGYRAIILPTDILNTCGIYLKEMYTWETIYTHLSIQTRSRMCVWPTGSMRLKSSRDVQPWLDIMRQNHKSTYLMKWLTDSPCDEYQVQKSTSYTCQRYARAHSAAVWVHTDASIHVTTGPITLPGSSKGSSKGSLITSFKIISIKNASWWQLKPQRKFWSAEKYTRLTFNLHSVQWLIKDRSHNTDV